MTVLVLHPSAHVDGMLDEAERVLFAAVFAALERSQASAGEIEDVVTLLDQGRYEEAVEIASQAGSLRIYDAVVAAYISVGLQTAAFLEEETNAKIESARTLEGEVITPITFGFDQAQPRAVDHMRQEKLRLIREFTDASRDATRRALTDGIERGLNPVAQARNFRDAIGLTEYQERTVINFRRALDNAVNVPSDALGRDLRDRRFDPSIRRAATTGQPLSAEHKERMVARYRERLLRYRAETIARTEALRATHTALHEAYQQFGESGSVAVEELQRTWISTRDNRVRRDHAAASGQKRGLHELFLVGGWPMLHPGDPNAPASQTINCRCAVTTRMILTPRMAA